MTEQLNFAEQDKRTSDAAGSKPWPCPRGQLFNLPGPPSPPL